MKGIIKDSLILFVITLVSGLLLGLVYEVTKDPIANQKAIAKAKACQAVFAEADEFVEVDFATMDGVTFDGGEIGEVLSAKATDGTELGFVITTTSHNGYGGDVTMLVGIQNDGTVNGISFTALNETAGLGMKAKNDEFKNQFAGKHVEQFAYTKSGAVADNEIDAISAATVTTNAVTEAVNGALDFFHNNLKVTGGAANE